VFESENSGDPLLPYPPFIGTPLVVVLTARMWSLFADETWVVPVKKLLPSSTKVAELEAVAFKGPPF
jgi:hypothetical protein